MPKKTTEEVKPGYYDFCLAQSPDPTTMQPVLRIVAYYNKPLTRGGKELDAPKALGQRFSFTPGVHVAALGCHGCRTAADGEKWHRYYDERWVKPFQSECVDTPGEERKP